MDARIDCKGFDPDDVRIDDIWSLRVNVNVNNNRNARYMVRQASVN